MDAHAVKAHTKKRRDTTLSDAINKFLAIRTEIIPHNIWYYSNILVSGVSIILSCISIACFTTDEPNWYVFLKMINGVFMFSISIGIQYSNYRAHYPKTQNGIFYSFSRNKVGVNVDKSLTFAPQE